MTTTSRSIRTRRARAAAAAAILAACALTSCTPSASPHPSESAAAGQTTYPVTVRNCGVDVTIDSEPRRVMITSSASVQFLASLDVLDRLVSRAGKFPPEYYSEATNAALDKVPSLTDQVDTSGHLRISSESIIAQTPDLMLGLPDGVTREMLASANIPVLLEPSQCPDSSGSQMAGYDTVYSQMEMYGQVFDRQQAAAQADAEFKQRVEDVERDLPKDQRGTAAVLWPDSGAGIVYAYGKRSMATPQLETLNYTNVFGDVDDRVFETSIEQILGRDPDFILLLHTDGTDGEIKQALLDLPGSDQLRAVKNDNVMVQLFNFTEPPTPLVLDGLERISHFVQGTR